MLDNDTCMTKMGQQIIEIQFLTSSNQAVTLTFDLISAKTIYSLHWGTVYLCVDFQLSICHIYKDKCKKPLMFSVL